MTIYSLYIKTHTITGLKYLGYTTKKDPHEYNGSGVYWKRHLKKYGATYTTTILKECTSNTEIAQYGSYYSQLWDIVESDEWANLIPETGKGAPSGKHHYMSNPEIHQKAVNTRKQNGSYVRSAASIEKGKATKLARYGTLNSSSAESTAKIIETRKRNGNWGQSPTPEMTEKQKESRRKNGTMNNNTAESIAKCLATKKLNNTSATSITVISKALETRRINGTMNTSTPASIAARIESRQKNILAGTDGVGLRVTCPHCGKGGGQSIMKRWHFDNCRTQNLPSIL